MSDIKITAEAIAKLKRELGTENQNVYSNCKEQFVHFLVQHQYDWKISREQRQTDLFHQALTMFCYSENQKVEPEKDIQLLINEIGGQIFKGRQGIKDDKEDGPMERKVAAKTIKKQPSFFTEAYELEQAMNGLTSKEKELLRNTFIEQTPANELTYNKADIEGCIQQLIKIVAGEASSSQFELNIVEGSYQLSSENSASAELISWMKNGFVGLSKQNFDQQLKRYEEISKDEGKLKKLKSSAKEKHGRELYLSYRKKNALNLTEESGFEMAVVLELFPKVWQTFIRNIDDGKLTAPLKRPLKDYLKSITLNYLGEKTEDNLDHLLDFTPSIIDQKLQDWDQAIQKEETILDQIKDENQLYYTKLVKEYRNDFIIALRKVFKLYDAGLRDRPADVFNRSFAEVIEKVRNNELKKPLTSTFKTYLIGVGLNHYRQYYFKKGEKPLNIDEGVFENIPEPDTIENLHINNQNAHKVKKILEVIGEPCKSLLEMRFLKGYSYEVIALRLQMKEGALRTRVYRCIEKIRAMIAEKN